MEYQIKYLGPEVRPENVWGHVETKLHLYVNEYMKEMVDSILNQLSNKLNLSNLLTGHLDQSTLTQRDRVRGAFTIIRSTEIMTSGAISQALEVLLNLNGNPQLSEMICNVIRKEFEGKVEVKPWFKWRQTIPPKPAYYIQRAISPRRRLTDGFLKEENEQDVFVFSGVSWSELSSLAGGKMTDRSSCQTRRITVQFILLEDEIDFGRICSCAKEVKKNVHWINKVENELYWVRSSGSVRILQKHLHQDQERLSEEKFVEKLEEAGDTKAVCLADAPGMGKTLLLANLAEQVQRRCPSKHVVFFVLREIVPVLEKELEEDYFISLILSCVETNAADGDVVCGDVWRRLMKSELVKEIEGVQFELFFDGFDEILSSQLGTCKRLFQSLLKLQNCRVHVTTRLHMLEELESALGVLGQNILPFSPEEQKRFLRKCWIEEHGALDTDHLSSFADECLKNIKSRMTDVECDIAGIPLQCWMLADVYSSDAVKYSKSESKYGINVEVASIFDLYDKLFQRKFSKVIEVFKPEDPNIVEVLKEFHVLQAFQLLLPDFLDMVSRVTLTDEEMKMVYSVGLIDSETPRFLHRTFAEALVAEYLVQGLPTRSAHHNRDLRRTSFLFRSILSGLERHDLYVRFFVDTYSGRLRHYQTTISSFRFQHQVINYFVDRNLQKLVHLVHYDRLSEDAQFLPHDDILIPCATNNFHHTFDFISKIMEQLDVPLHNPTDLCFITSAYSRDWNMMRKAAELAGDITTTTTTVDGVDFTPLHAAVHAGSFTVSRYLLRLYQDNIPAGLLHCCVSGSSKDPEATVNEKMEIIRMIVGEKKATLDELWGGVPPILCEVAHHRLLECLITLGADVNAVGKENQSVLHTVDLEIMTASSFIAFCNLLLSHGFHRWGEVEKRCRQTPLHRALEYIEADTLLLTFFKERGLDFNARDSGGNSVLMEVVKYGSCVDCIKLLCEFGSDVWAKNYKDQNALILAATKRRFEILRYLVERSDCKEHINEADKNGSTPLHWAAKEYPDGVRLLLEAGADVYAKNSEGMIPLMLALNARDISSSGVASIVTGMEKNGLEIMVYLPHLLHFLLLSKYDWGAKKESFGDLLVRCRKDLESFCKSKDIMYDSTQNCTSNANLHALALYLDAVVEPHKHDEYTDILEGFKFEEAKISSLQPQHILLVKEICESFLHGKKFSTTPPGVNSFINSKTKLLIIKTFDLDLCLQRLTEWFLNPNQAPKREQDLESFLEWENGSLRSSISDGVHIFRGEELHTKCLSVLTKGKQNVMITTSDISEESRRLLPEIHEIVEDALNWNDLSLAFQYQIAHRIYVTDESSFCFCRTSKLQYCNGLQNNDICRLISNLEKRHNFSVELNETISGIIDELGEELVLYLENSAFHQIFPQKLQNTLEVTQESKEKVIKAGVLEKAEPHPVFQNEVIAWYFATRKILRDEVSPDTPNYFSINQFMKEIGIVKNECGCDAFLHYPQDLVLFYLDHFAETKMYSRQIKIKSILCEDLVFFEAACHHNAQNLPTVLLKYDDVLHPLKLNHISTLITYCLQEKRVSEAYIALLQKESRLRPTLVAEGVASYLRAKAEGERMSCMKLILWRLPAFKSTGAGTELVKALANAGLTQCLHARNYFGETIIHLILEGQDPDPTFFKIFKEAGFDFNLEDKFGKILLFHAIYYMRSVEVIKALVENGADFSRRNRQGSTLIHYAIYYHAEYRTEYCASVLQYLMTLGLDVNTKDVLGRTPLDLLGSLDFEDRTEAKERIRTILESSSTN